VHRFFEERFRQLGGRVILNESYQQGDAEFRPQLGRIQAARPDLLVAAAYTYKDAGLIVQQMGAVGLRTPVMGADGWFVEDLLSMAGPGLEGAICATGADTNAPEFQGFNQEFEARNRGTKATIYTYYGLDALMLLEHAVRTATAGGGTPDPSALRAALENATGVQLFTSRVTMEKDTHNPHDKPILLEQVRRGRWALLETFDPAAR
jgi:branched-chain amino acid transport system substrate-binding protein